MGEKKQKEIGKRRYGILIFGIILVDHIIKFLFISYFPQKVFVNTGISFSFLADTHSILTIVLHTCGVMVMVYLLKSSQPKIAFLLLLAGGLSNLIDRIVYGGVIDFIRIGSLPIFNFADSIINLGLVIFIIYIVKDWMSRLDET
ncbi:signal peptidase II [Candidatus Dojkabacteria bacterium]|uniref:Lipoprotein signal peptidase n=1 Tax=Candidatus Dojkabacteria bacterium TaxID=2099670 RepID=A0A955L840_9BACT|nr:signal peptidase II [Candidatus Dojkabacteria bacterium]